jgi:sporulation protein YlmC with PRC-barrel domain
VDEVEGILIDLAARVVNRRGETLGQVHEAVVEVESEEVIGFLVMTDEVAPREVFLDMSQVGEIEAEQLSLDLTDEEFVALPAAREHLFVAPGQDVEAEIAHAESTTASQDVPDPDERPAPSAIPGIALTPNLMVPLAVERSVIGEGEIALRHGMRIRTDNGEEIGQIGGLIMDDEGRLIALTLLGEEGEAILFSVIDTVDDDANELIVLVEADGDESPAE